MIIALILAFLFRTLTVTVMGFILFGIGWALVNVNSIVIIWELAPNLKKIGTYTGLYYFFSVLAAILGPMLIGMMTDASEGVEAVRAESNCGASGLCGAGSSKV